MIKTSEIILEHIFYYILLLQTLRHIAILKNTVVQSESWHWHQANSTAKLECQLFKRNSADEIRCYVPLHTSRNYKLIRRSRKRVDFFSGVVVGLFNSVKEFAVIPHDALFISEGFMNSFLTQWIAELFQGNCFSGNYGSQLFSTRAHLSFALIFF